VPEQILAYLARASVTKGIKFYNIDTWWFHSEQVLQTKTGKSIIVNQIFFIRNGKHISVYSDIERALSAFLIPSTKISETQRNL